MSIVLRLKKLRTSLGLTQEQFALKIGLKKGSYANIESGNDPLVQRTINAISLAFPNINSDYLISGRGAPLKPSEARLLLPAMRKAKFPRKHQGGRDEQGAEHEIGSAEVIKVLRELLHAKDQIIADKEKQVNLLEKLLQK
jgi:transcriptional regulator with XRE-family HTH domain